MDSILAADTSDLAQKTKFTCEACLPDSATKEKIWSEILDPESTFSLYQKRAKMVGFFQINQIEICTPFFDKFFDSLENFESQSFKFIEIFFKLMLPRFVIKDAYLQKMENLKTSDAGYQKVVADGLELLLRSKSVREFANN